MSPRFCSLWIAAALALGVAPAFALTSSTAAAEALFQDGRKAFKAGKYAEACPKLEESQRLDPATGTLLALALCHEQEKKFASAWAEFTDVEARARRESRKDRESLAREHATALRPRLSTLMIEVPREQSQLPDFEIRIDGSPSGSGSWGVAVPIDGGDHLVEAKATGKKPWSKRITIEAESDAAHVAVPSLANAEVTMSTVAQPATEQGVKGDAGTTPPSDAATSQGKSGGMRLAGVVTGGVGLAVVGVGSVLALQAKSKYVGAKEDCGSTCPAGPHATIEAARAQGNVATALFVGGGVAVAAGVALWFLAPRSPEGSQAKLAPSIRRVGLGLGNLTVEGSF